MTSSGVLHSRQFAEALESAGVVSGIDSVERVVIDIRAGQFVEVYVQRTGDERLLGIVPMLADAQVIEQPKAVRYWVLVSDLLMEDGSGPPGWPSSLRPVRPDESAPPPDAYSRWWLFEDDDAPPELEGKRVELTFTRGQVAQDGSYETRTVRRVVAR